MGLLNILSEWNKEQYNKRVDEMKVKSHCPDCHGHGHHMVSNTFFYVVSDRTCKGCKGSGQYDDWSELNNQ
ncbi:methionine aminopeptidase [Evansella sp. AB-rgal1]|uniref:methionine aminopeptidase n=1 Tax=Evansella sp. AB-rgal1 TaxID=3242696 RepID=UPI00359D5850